MASDLVTRTDRDGLATLTLNRPQKLNSLNTEMFEASVSMQLRSVGLWRRSDASCCAALDAASLPDMI
jgi:hypothetical protein